METKETMTVLNKKTGELETFNIHTGELVASSGQLVPTHHYTIELADAICNLVREGKTFKEISKELKVPRYLILEWRHMHPDFAKRLNNARKDRATYFMDKAVEVLEESDIIEKEEVPGKKFKFDSYVKLAGMDSPSEYAPKPQVAQTAAPATIVINTGINRDPIQIQGLDDERNTIQQVTIGSEESDYPSEEDRGTREEGTREVRASGSGSQEEGRIEEAETRGAGVEEEREARTSEESFQEEESKEKGEQEE